MSLIFSCLYIIQPRTAGSRLYCRRFNASKSAERDGLVSPLNCVSAISKQLAIIAFCTRESAMIFWTARKSGPEARLKSYVNRCHISAWAHKFKSAVLVPGVPFQKTTLKKLEHILPCKSSGPCPNRMSCECAFYFTRVTLNYWWITSLQNGPP